MIGIDEMEGLISDNLESLVDINENLGYLVSNGTLALDQMPGQRNAATLRSFSTLVADSYSLKRIDLKDGFIQEGLQCLVIDQLILTTPAPASASPSLDPDDPFAAFYDPSQGLDEITKAIRLAKDDSRIAGISLSTPNLMAGMAQTRFGPWATPPCTSDWTPPSTSCGTAFGERNPSGVPAVISGTS